jgi:hypothetical protein
LQAVRKEISIVVKPDVTNQREVRVHTKACPVQFIVVGIEVEMEIAITGNETIEGPLPLVSVVCRTEKRE